MGRRLQIRGCPWCGARGVPTQDTIRSEAAFRVDCQNNACPARPGVSSARSLNDAIATWNFRHVERCKNCDENKTRRDRAKDRRRRAEQRAVALRGGPAVKTSAAKAASEAMGREEAPSVALARSYPTPPTKPSA